MIAGPNGSGKTTLIEDLREKYNFGYYLNADDIEKELKDNSFVDISRFEINVSDKDFQKFLNSTTLTKKIRNKSTLNLLKLTPDRKIVIENKADAVNSYIAALITQYLRSKFIASKKKFSFETVMSHESKLELLKHAKNNGFRIYLYYVATESPKINEYRVEMRVKKGGHPVEKKKIRSRYYRSLSLLLDAIKLSDRAYLFDNSYKTKYKLIAEITKGKYLRLEDESFVPSWYVKYVENKLIL